MHRLAGFQRGLLDRGDQRRRAARRHDGLHHQAHGLLRGVLGRRMGVKDHGVARGDHADGVVDDRGGGVGGGHQPRHNAHWPADINGALLPVFRQVFRQLGLEMSGISGALLGIGETLSRYSTAFLVLLAAMIGFILFLVLHPKGQELIRKIVCRFPGMKEIPVNLDYSRLCQCISLGIRSGLSPELCVELAGAVVSQTEIREKLASIQKQLAEGYGFTEAITESGLFKAMELRLISLGFQAGASDEVMEKLAEQYEEKSTDSVSHIVSILEPTIVIVLSILVGLVLLSVMMPLLGLLSEMIA